MDSSSATKRSSGITVRSSTQNKRKIVCMKFNCDICQKSFSSRHCLKEHNYKHLDLKPYNCQVCQEQFRYLSQLACHKETHQEPTQFLDIKNSGNDEAKNEVIKLELRDENYTLPLIVSKQEFILPRFHDYFKNS